VTATIPDVIPVAAAQFNVNFYVVGATVLPIYLVALMLPGGVIFKYITLGHALNDRRKARRPEVIEKLAAGGLSKEDTELFASDLSIGVFRILFGVQIAFGLLVPAAFGFGEICSVVALDTQSASGFEHTTVLITLIALPILACSIACAISLVGPITVPGGDA
jgi:hypothetical protein